MIQSSLFCSNSYGTFNVALAGKKHNREFLLGSSSDLSFVFINDVVQKAVLLYPEDKELWDVYENICKNMNFSGVEKSSHIRWKKQKGLSL